MIGTIGRRGTDIPRVTASKTNHAQRRALEADEKVRDDGEVQESEDGADDVVVGLGHGLAALNGASVALVVVVPRRSGWCGALRVCKDMISRHVRASRQGEGVSGTLEAERQ